MMRRGLSLVEVTISMVVVSVMLVAGLRLVGATGQTSRFVEDRTIGQELVEAMLADISAQPYEDPDDTPVFGLEEAFADARPGGTWIGFDDVDDYDGLIVVGGADRHGEAIVPRAGWQVRVEVAWVLTSDPEVPSDQETGLKRVDVSAIRDGRTVTTASMLAGREGRDRRADVPGTVDVLEPLSRMLVTPRRGPVPLVLELDATASRDPVGDGLTHRWLVDGAVVIEEAKGQFIVTTAGVKTVTLVVRDSLGRAASSSMFVVAEP